MDKITIVVPCYNEEDALEYFYAEMKKVMGKMQEVCFEILFVDDGSKDQTLAKLRTLSELDPRCRYLSFSRNFGKEAAIYAGLSHASGDYIGIIDADLQDPPGLLPEMYQMLYWEDCDCVAARRSDRKGEPRLKSFLSDRFYKVLNKLSKIQLVSGARDYRVFGSAPFPGCGYRFAFLYNFLSDDRIYSLSHLDFRRPGTGLAFYGLHHFSGRRDTAFLYGNPGRISGKNIFRDKTPAYLHIKRIQRRKL